jgi:hypothetical protein
MPSSDEHLVLKKAAIEINIEHLLRVRLRKTDSSKNVKTAATMQTDCMTN